MHNSGEKVLLKRLVFGFFGIFFLASVACGPITDEDLKKWSQNEEGLKRLTEVMEDESVPFHIKVDAVVILVENNWSSRVRGILSKYKDPVALASTASEKMVEMLSAGDDAALNARDGLFALLGTMDDEHRDVARKALAEWGFKGISAEQTREQMFEMVANKLALNQVRDLGEYAVPASLLMMGKRVESDAWGMLQWCDFIFSFYNPEEEDAEKKAKSLGYKKEALEAIKRYHKDLFKAIEAGEDTFFDPNDVLLVEKFDMPETVAYLLELARHPKVDPATQYEAMIIAEKMFDSIIPEKDYDKYLDNLLSVIVNKLPEIRDRTGMNRLKQAKMVLEKSQIQGLKDIPLVIEKEVDGKVRTNFKPYISRRNFSTGKFMYGVVSDFLNPLVDKEKEKLLKEWEEKWKKEHPEAAAALVAKAGDKKDVKAADKKDAKAADKKDAKAADKKDDKATDKKDAKKVAKADDKKPVEAATAAASEKPVEEMPDFTMDNAFNDELDLRVDKSVTPLMEDWVSAELGVKRVFGVAGLKFLETPKAIKLLEGLVADKKDLTDYLGAGITIGSLATNGLKGIALSKELQQLKITAIRDKLINPREIEVLRQKMMRDLTLSGAELDKKYREELKKRQDRYAAQKAKMAKLIASYQKAIRRLCLGLIKDYPKADATAEMEKYIDNTTISCRVASEERLTKKKLDFFGFTEQHYRSAVVLGIMKKEIARKYVIMAKARAYLKAAVESGVNAPKVQKTLAKVKTWKLDDRKLRDVIDKFVKIALDMASDDSEKSGGKRGIAAADIKEYRGFIELPENYAMAVMLATIGKIIWNDVDEKTNTYIPRSLFKDSATKSFDAKTYFKTNTELVDHLMDNYDDLWYVLQDLATQGAVETKKRWGMSEELFAQYKKLDTKVNSVINSVYAKTVEDKTLKPEQVAVIKPIYPAYEVVTEALTAQFDVIRKARLEEDEKKRLEAEAKAKAAEDKKAPKKEAGEKKDAKKSGKDAPAKDSKPAAKPAAKTAEKPAAKTAAKTAEKPAKKPAEKKSDAKAEAKPAK
jgi:hypothetical protein